jgi:hypothetical protein
MKHDIQSLINITKDIGLDNVLGHLADWVREKSLATDDKEAGLSLESLTNKLQTLANEVSEIYGGDL